MTASLVRPPPRVLSESPGEIFHRRVARFDPALPLSDLETVRAQVEESLAPEWFRTGLVAIFAGLALLLAAIGIYGVE